MSVRRIVSADGIEYQNAAALRRQAPALYRLYDLSCRLNTAATLGDQTVLGGNATERALLESVRRLPPSPSSPCLGSLPFDSVKKYSAVSLGVPAETVLIKGAPERLLPFLQTAYRSDGRTVPFSRLSSAFLRQIGTLTANGERVLLLAECSALPSGNHFEPLTLIGAVSLNDKIRTEAPPSIRKLREAGIQTVMITGDHRDTARQIAVQCGILTPSQNLIVSSEELARCSDEAVKEMLPRLAVVARALPSDKSRLVRLAQETERVVGMTGDGINDAPALKRADIGFAMGSGAAVAKDAGDIIILDNNLSSIAKAVLYGRTIFKSIRKFITLQLTMNFCAVGVSMIGPFIGYDAPVTVTQMLWINLIMDTLGGLAFAGEAPSPRYMKEKPKRRDEPILNRYMVHQIVFLGGFTVALCLAFLLLPSITSSFRAEPNRLYLLTAFFALFIFTSVFNCFNTRSDRLNLFSGLSKNKPFLFIMSAVCVVQLLFVYLGGDILRTLPLTPSELKRTLLLSLSVFPAEFLRKVMWRLGRHTDGF